MNEHSKVRMFVPALIQVPVSDFKDSALKKESQALFRAMTKMSSPLNMGKIKPIQKNPSSPY